MLRPYTSEKDMTFLGMEVSCVRKGWYRRRKPRNLGMANFWRTFKKSARQEAKKIIRDFKLEDYGDYSENYTLVD